MASSFPSSEQHQVLELKARKLEVRTHEAKPKDGQQPRGIAIVCHPHPLYGGTMDNKVVHTLCRAYRDLGIHAVRFNFRGVGQSEGTYDNGKGEQDDLALMLEWAHKLEPALPIYLAGFSFGAFVAASYANQAAESISQKNKTDDTRFTVKHLLLVAPPVHHFGLDNIKSFSCPLAIIQGLDDEVVPAEKVINWAKSVQIKNSSADNKSIKFQPPQLFTLEQTSHFFHGKLNELKTCVGNAIGEENKRSDLLL